MFDVAAVRAALEARLRSLESELHQVERLQRKFASIHSTLAQQATPKPAEPPASPMRASFPLSSSVPHSLSKARTGVPMINLTLALDLS